MGSCPGDGITPAKGWIPWKNLPTHPSRETPASCTPSRNIFNGHKSGVQARSLNFYTIQKYTFNKIKKIDYFSY